MVFTVVGIAALAIIGFWLFGGVVLRVAGIVFVFAGLITLTRHWGTPVVSEVDRDTRISGPSAR